MQVDFLIAGQGLAGSALALALRKKGASVLVVDRGDEWSASRVAAGLVTTVAGKGMNPFWRQRECLDFAMPWYAEIERISGQKLFHELPILRLFDSEKQRDKFHVKADSLGEWVSETAAEIDSEKLHADFGGFEMSRSGRLDTVAYLKAVRMILGEAFRQGEIREDEVDFDTRFVQWHGVRAHFMISCLGAFGLGKGWFNHITHRSAKGDILTVRIDDLDPQRIINRNGWLVPLGQGIWRAGATYLWEHLNGDLLPSGCAAVEEKISQFTSCDYEVLSHQAGVRPIITRSQPTAAMHPEIARLGVFNGLGSKGVTSAPLAAEEFAIQLVQRLKGKP